MLPSQSFSSHLPDEVPLVSGSGIPICEQPCVRCTMGKLAEATMHGKKGQRREEQRARYEKLLNLAHVTLCVCVCVSADDG